MTNALILSAVRTPLGSMSGGLSTVPAPRLGTIAVQHAVERAKIAPADISEVIMGNVVAAGLGQNPARQAMIFAGLPTSVPAMTVNKVCGSGLKAVMLAAQSIRLGESSLVVAGGMENMSLAPHLLPQARAGYRLGHGTLIDAMIHDGLWDVYGQQHMGAYGDQCAAKFQFTRQQQDDFAVRSFERARAAIAGGAFADEIIPVEVAAKKSTTVVREDEGPARFDEAKLRKLSPAFSADGTITAGNASSISDGAAALVIASSDEAARRNIEPLARIVGSATFSQDPAWFTTAPIGALQKLLAQLRWLPRDVDLYEINEAFAAVAMAAEHELGLPPERVNIHGGAVALGHPIGATGARILVTLVHALRRTGGRRGIACLCIGGGEAIALAIESPQ